MDNLSQGVGESVVETEEINVSQSSSDIEDLENISFEEVADIDEIQKKIQEQIDQEGLNEESSNDPESNADIDDEVPTQEPALEAEVAFDLGTGATADDSSDSTADIEFEQIEDQIKHEIELRLKAEMEQIGALKEDKVSEQKAQVVNLPISEPDPNAKKYVVYVDSDNIDFMESLSIQERRMIINKILREQNGFLVKQREIERTQRFLRHSLVATFTFIIGFPILFFSVNKATKATMDNLKEAKSNFSRLYKDQGKIKSVGSQSAEHSKY